MALIEHLQVNVSITDKVRVQAKKQVLLTLSQGEKKKGDEVADDEDDDAVRTSVSQDSMTATLST